MTVLPILLTTAIVLMSNGAYVAAASRPPRDYAPETSRNTENHTSCCLIPTCDENNRCYKTLSCGYICSQNGYRSANIKATSGYKLRPHYSKYACKFGECKEYKFLCNHCPNPEDEPDFNYYSVRNDCRYCYDGPQY